MSSPPPSSVSANPQAAARAPNILVVAGEASGDVHAAALLRSLKACVPSLTAFGMGGPHLRKAGLDVLFEASDISVMGLVEVVPKLFRILSILRALDREAQVRRPDLAVLIDVPDFNLRLAKRLKALGIPVVYYVSPKVWASRPWRVKTIAKRVDTMLCILPFEVPWLRAHGIDARYVGNPVLDALPPPGPVASFRDALGLDIDRRTLAIVPGSRPSEITRILPIMCEAARKLIERWPDLQLVVPVAPSLQRSFLEGFFERANLHPILIQGRVCDVVGASDAAMVCSGTAALEAGLMLRPLVVVYRVHPLTALVFRLISTVKHISLVNLLAGREIVPELFQRDCTADRVTDEIVGYLSDEHLHAQMVQDLGEVRAILGSPGASARAANAVLDVLDRIGRLPAGSRTIEIGGASPDASSPPSSSPKAHPGEPCRKTPS
jgi:lipid-A-disaccharide synthase